MEFDVLKKILMISQQTPHYTGGRYYAYQVLVNLALLGHEVTLLVDRPDLPFAEDYAWANQAIQVERANFLRAGSAIRKMSGRTFDLIISIPVEGVKIGSQLARQMNIPMWTFIYDVPTLLAQYRSGEHVQAVKIGYWTPMLRAMRAANALAVCLSKYNCGFCEQWYGKMRPIDYLYPAVNDGLIKEGLDEREPFAIWISRIVPHKLFPHFLDAVKPLNLDAHVFCSRRHDGLVNRAGMKNRTVFYVNAPDTLKFDVLRRASVMCVPAIYEGFGMWMIEALATGTPVVTYNYPGYREIAKGSPGIVKFAQSKQRGQLTQLMAQVMFEHPKPDTRWTMAHQRQKLNDMLEKYT